MSFKKKKNETPYLEIFLEKGINLAPRDSNGKSDPYVVFKLGSQTTKSTTKKKTLNPMWYETRVIEVREIDNLMVEVWNWNLFRKPDFIGRVEIALADILSGVEDYKVKLKSVETGELVLKISPWRFSKELIDQILKSNEQVNKQQQQSFIDTPQKSSNEESKQQQDEKQELKQEEKKKVVEEKVLKRVSTPVKSNGVVEEGDAPETVSGIYEDDQKSVDSPNVTLPTYYRKDDFNPESDSDDEKETSEYALNGKYKLIKQIGQGGMGIVYLGEYLKGKEMIPTRVAIKKVLCNTDEDFNRAMKEVWPVKGLKHDGIVQYEDIFMEKLDAGRSNMCIVMEYFDEGDLAHYLQEMKNENKHLPQEQVLSYMEQLSAALVYIHDAKLLHRDLKPENIFVSQKKTVVKIGDFGLVREMDQTFATTVAGTTKYMAPEILDMKKYNTSADMWSLGCIFYEVMLWELKSVFYMQLFTNKNFHNDISAAIKQHYAAPLADLVVSLLLQDPTKRPSAKDVLKQVKYFRSPEYKAIISRPDRVVKCRLALDRGCGPNPRAYHTVVRKDDTLYLCAGHGAKAAFFEYNIKTKIWKLNDAPNAPEKRYSHTMEIYEDKIFVFGGVEGIYENRVSYYDITKKTWTKLPAEKNSPPGRFCHSSALYKDKMIIFGGYNGKYLGDTHQFDCKSLKWVPMPKTTGTPPCARFRHTAVIHKDTMYIWGGSNSVPVNSAGGNMNDLHALDMSGSEYNWKQITCVGNIPKGRRGHSASVWKDTMFIFGGWDPFLNDMYELDLNIFVWRQVKLTEKIPSKRHGHSSIVIGDQLYIWGGRDEKNYNAEHYELDLVEIKRPPEKKEVFSVNLPKKIITCRQLHDQGSIPNARAYQTVVNYKDQYIYFCAGHGAKQQFYCYNIGTQTWVNIPAVGAPKRYSHTMEIFGDRIFVFGGVEVKYQNTVCMFDINTGIWTTLPVTQNSPPGRFCHSSAAYNGKMIIFGGFNGTYLNDLHQFDMAALTWVPIPKISGKAPSPRFRHTATIYKNKMYIFGGSDSLPVNSPHGNFNELYALDLSDPNHYKWSEIKTIGNIPPRRGHSACECNGKLYVFGGCYPFNNEFYELDLNTYAWKQIEIKGAIPSNRHGHSAIIVRGKMYVWGGRDMKSYNTEHYEFLIDPSQQAQPNVDLTIIKSMDVSKYPFGKNLLKNGSCELGAIGSTMPGWTVIKNGGNGWSVENSTTPCPSVTTGKNFVTSYDWCIREQVIDLSDLFPTEILNLCPPIEISEWYMANTGEESSCEISAELLDSNDRIITAVGSGELQCQQGKWKQYKHVFTNYGTAVAKVKFSDKGKDKAAMPGFYGAKLTGATVIVHALGKN